MNQSTVLGTKSYRVLTLAILALLALAASARHAQTYTGLYNFGAAAGDPTNPQSSGIVAQGRDGELYSTAPSGGSSGLFGAAFKISSSGALVKVFNFTSSGGSSPFAD